jgi:peroxin-1
VFAVSVDPQSKTGPVLLTTDTEVSIAPKPHSSPVPPLSKLENENPSQNPFPQLLRVLPSRLVQNVIPTTTSQTALAFLSPQTFAQLAQQYNLVDGSNPRSFHRCSLLRFSPPTDPTAPHPTDQTDASEVQVYIAPDNHIPPRHIALFFSSDTGIGDWDIVRYSPFLLSPTHCLSFQ